MENTTVFDTTDDMSTGQNGSSSLETSPNISTTRGMSQLEYLQAIVDIAEQMPMFKAGHAFEILNFFFLPPLAMVCNGLSLATMVRLKPFTSTSLYICSLAVNDTLVLFIKAFLYCTDEYDWYVGDYGCGLIYFLMTTVLYVAVWTIVMMTLERFAAVIYPLRVNSLFTMRRTKISIIVVYILSAMLSGHYIYTIMQVISPFRSRGVLCTFRPDTRRWTQDIWFWLNTAVFAILPCTALFVLNVTIVLGMRSAFQKQKKMVLDDSTKKDAQQRQLTVMLLTMSFSYIVFFVPVCVMMITLIDFNMFESAEVFARLRFLTSFVFFFSSLNHAVNFFFYFASNRRFRSALCQLVRCQEVGKPGQAGKYTANSVQTISSMVSKG